MGPDLTAAQYAKAPSYEEAARRFAPYVGTAYQKGVTLSPLPVEIYAIFGGQWPHSSFMIPGGVMCAPDPVRRHPVAARSSTTGSTSGSRAQWLGCSVDRWLADQDVGDFQAWMDENEAQHNSDLAFFMRYAQEIGLDTVRPGLRQLPGHRHVPRPRALHRTRPSRAATRRCMSRSGIYAGGQYYDFDQTRVTEDITHSFYRGTGSRHPCDGVTDPIDPAEGRKQGKYTWAKSPRYDVPGQGFVPLEVGPAGPAGHGGPTRRRRAPGLRPADQERDRPASGPSVMTRVLARVHEAPKYYRLSSSG